jgi:hypothetical protein
MDGDKAVQPDVTALDKYQRNPDHQYISRKLHQKHLWITPNPP